MEYGTMNATSLYVSTCRLILQANADDRTTWVDIHQIFPNLRQALSCSVCSNLLIEPYSPAESSCQHNVCKACRGGKKKLRTTCGWCKDYSKYYENVELRTLLQCYKKLCHYVTSTQIYKILNSPTGSNINNGTVASNKALIEIIEEGSGFKDNFIFESSPVVSSSVKSKSTQMLNNGKGVSDKTKGTTSVENGRSTYSVISTNNGNRLTFKRTAKEINDVGQRNGDAEKADVKVNKVRKRSVFTKPPECKCGQNAPTKGTCRGYRCPCYTADKPCSPECNCVACKNPRGVPPPKDEGIVDVNTDNSAVTSTVTII